MGGKLTQDEFIRRVKAANGDKYTVLSQYTSGHNKVLIRHNDCGYEWNVDPWNMMKGQIKNCPFCSNKWKRNTEDFKKEVFNLYGDEYEVVGEYQSTNKPLLMRHKVCGKTFERIPREFKQGVLCPTCRRPNYFETTETFKKRLLAKYKGMYIMLGEYKSARSKTKFKCTKCGLEWECTPDSLMRDHGCPHCSMSKGEDKIKNWFIDNNISFKSQYSDKRCRDERVLKFDFAVFDKDGSVKVLIEFDGIQHFRATRFNSHMSNELCEKNLVKVKRHDEIKNEFCKINHIPLLRITYKQFNKIEKILEDYFTMAIPC